MHFRSTHYTVVEQFLHASRSTLTQEEPCTTVILFHLLPDLRHGNFWQKGQPGLVNYQKGSPLKKIVKKDHLSMAASLAGDTWHMPQRTAEAGPATSTGGPCCHYLWR